MSFPITLTAEDHGKKGERGKPGENGKRGVEGAGGKRGVEGKGAKGKGGH